jgi:plasmid stabilization system protein ParE
VDLIVRPEAEADLAEASDWYRDHDIAVRDAFVARVEAAFDRIALKPNHFPRAGKLLRRASVRGFPYSVYFSAVGGQISVIAVLHHRRDASVLDTRLN